MVHLRFGLGSIICSTRRFTSCIVLLSPEFLIEGVFIGCPSLCRSFIYWPRHTPLTRTEMHWERKLLTWQYKSKGERMYSWNHHHECFHVTSLKEYTHYNSNCTKSRSHEAMLPPQCTRKHVWCKSIHDCVQGFNLSWIFAIFKDHSWIPHLFIWPVLPRLLGLWCMMSI